jgi:diguanylate cyclase (GGDEF)-like protein
MKAFMLRLVFYALISVGGFLFGYGARLQADELYMVSPLAVPAVAAIVLGAALIDFLASRWLARSRRRRRPAVARPARAIRKLVPHDVLTGLPSESSLITALDRVLVSGAPPERIAVVLIDIPAFRQLQDNLGVAAGDLLLRHVSARLLAGFRESDVLARVGPSRFAALLPEVDEPGSIARLCRRLNGTLRTPFDLFGHTTYAGLAFGAAFVGSYDRNEVEPKHHAVLDQAAAALERALPDGVGAIRFADRATDEAYRRRILLVDEFEAAFAANELELEFEPQFRADSRRLAGVVVSPRWRHEEEGRLGEAEIQSLADERGLVPALFRWLLARGADQVAVWQRQGAADLTLTISLPASLELDQELLIDVESELRRARLAPQQVLLALDEHAAARQRTGSLQILHGLRQAGCRLVLSDFGAGDGSLRRLRAFGWDRIEVDVGGIDETTAGSDRAAIIGVALSLAGQYGIEMLGSGVETETQIGWLGDVACACLAGPYLMPLASSKEISALVTALAENGQTAGKASTDFG